MIIVADLVQCGSASIYLLNSGFDFLDTGNAADAQASFQALLDLSHERILAYPYKEVPDCWRRLYTDATLLRVLALLVSGATNSSEIWIAAVKDLDKVLIVAGAPGHRRQEYTHALIRLVQQQHLPHGSVSRFNDSLALSDTSSDLFHLNQPIKRFTPESAPTIEDFLSSAFTTPFIISEGVKFWPAFSKWSSLEYLQSTAGRGRIVPVEVGGTYTQEAWSQEMMDFDTFLESLCKTDTSGQDSLQHSSRSVLYLAQHDLLRQLPSLEDDFTAPDYVYMSPPATADAPTYTPPDADRGYLVNLWLGPSNTHSPAHTDPYYNCYGEHVPYRLSTND